MNNNMNFDGYGYQDMNLFNSMFLPNNQNMINMDETQMMNNINMSNMNNMNSNISGNKNLARAYEGYIRGNLYNNLYQEYKNYKPAKLVPKNEQAELLLNANQMSFAAHELKLYLDIYPDDTNMISMYNEYQKQASEAIKRYERKYGPILADSPSQTNKFSWEAYNWPWVSETGEK